MIKKSLFTLFLLINSILQARTVEIFDLKAQKEVSFAQLGSHVDDNAFILLGEVHYEARMTTLQSNIIEHLVKLKKAQGHFTVAWEFMDYPDQTKIAQDFGDYVADRQSFSELLQTIFPGQKPQDNFVYRPIFDSAKKYKGKILATNAPRVWKRVIVAKGVEALDSDQVPVGMRRGSDHYFDRFYAAVGGHGDPSALEGYFMAQSYTDAVMAEQLVKTPGLLFMVVGHFHTDYGHGLPDYLDDLSSRQIVNVRLVDASALSDAELLLLKVKNNDYGYIGDYLLIMK